jgi:hypothetical protein
MDKIQNEGHNHITKRVLDRGVYRFLDFFLASNLSLPNLFHAPTACE